MRILASLGRGPFIVMIHGFPDLWTPGETRCKAWAKDATLVTVPEAVRFVQQDASTFVTATMRSWWSTRS